MTEVESMAAAKPGLKRLGLLVAVGLGAMVLLGLWALRREASAAAPERLKQKVNVMVQDLLREHWTAMRTAVEQISTDAGAKVFFASNPGLSPRIPSEQAFLELARSWRSLVQPLPEAMPGLESHALTYVKQEGQAEMRYRVPNGTFIFMKWSEARLVEMRIY